MLIFIQIYPVRTQMGSVDSVQEKLDNAIFFLLLVAISLFQPLFEFLPIAELTECCIRS